MPSELLNAIHAGMTVVDGAGEKIGTVELVKYGDDDPATPEPEAASISPVEAAARGRSLLDTIADAFRADGLPEEVRERLLHQGFVRIDADGLFKADRYVTPEQIAGIEGGQLVLKVRRGELFEAP